MTVEDIKKICEEAGDTYYGLRIDSMQYNIGDICENSHQLFQDPEWDETGELLYPYIYDKTSPYYGFYDAGELNGTCSVKFDPENDESIKNALKTVNNYQGKYLYIIGGYDMEYGNDDNEIIIIDAEVIYLEEKRG